MVHAKLEHRIGAIGGHAGEDTGALWEMMGRMRLENERGDSITEATIVVDDHELVRAFMRSESAG